MRLFAAIELSDEARGSIAAEQRRIVDDWGPALRSIRLVRTEHLHLTLVFIGETIDSRVSDVIAAGQRDIPMPPFELVFGGIGTFPPRGRPRILWLGTLAGAQEAIELQQVVARRLVEAGVPLEQRSYRPHLTLGRWRDARDRRATGSRRFTTAAKATSTERRDSGSVTAPHSGATRPVARVLVTEVTLFQSRLSSTGPTYTALARARLT